MEAIASADSLSLLTAALWILLGYFLGSIPSGVLIARAKGLGDLRQIGSGNIGATNVLRTGDKTAAALTLLGDALKGAAAVLLARHWGGEWAAGLAGLAAFVGHCWPVWLRFCGGKGVATFLGVLLALAWPVGLAACATWMVVALTLRISSLSALVAAALSPFWALLFGRAELFGLLLILAALVFWRHKANLLRLRAGTEPKIGKS